MHMYVFIKANICNHPRNVHNIDTRTVTVGTLVYNMVVTTIYVYPNNVQIQSKRRVNYVFTSISHTHTHMYAITYIVLYAHVDVRVYSVHALIYIIILIKHQHFIVKRYSYVIVFVCIFAPTYEGILMKNVFDIDFNVSNHSPPSRGNIRVRLYTRGLPGIAFVILIHRKPSSVCVCVCIYRFKIFIRGRINGFNNF